MPQPLPSPSPDFLSRFSEEGYYCCERILEAAACARAETAIRNSRPFGPELFMTEEAYNASEKTHYGTNPLPGRNILDTLDTTFVTANHSLRSYIAALLGENFRWFYSKLVCRVPRDAMPAWVLNGIGLGPTTTLGAFIKPEYRDIAYYHDNEIHQDIMDYARMPEENKEHRLITLYVYLDDVTLRDAPTCVAPGTHLLGAGNFPYDITKTGSTWQYRHASGQSMETSLKPVPTPAGSVLMWHSCLLHGAKPIADGRWRFGIRYMLACAKGAKNIPLDTINARIQNPLYQEKETTARAIFPNHNGFLLMPQSDWTRSYFE